MSQTCEEFPDNLIADYVIRCSGQVECGQCGDTFVGRAIRDEGFCGRGGSPLLCPVCAAARWRALADQCDGLACRLVKGDN